jgi:hypothetical protein
MKATNKETQLRTLRTRLADFGWELVETDTEYSEWWLQEVWTIESLWTPRSLRVYLMLVLIDDITQDVLYEVRAYSEKPPYSIEPACPRFVDYRGEASFNLGHRWLEELEQFLLKLNELRQAQARNKTP